MVEPLVERSPATSVAVPEGPAVPAPRAARPQGTTTSTTTTPLSYLRAPSETLRAQLESASPRGVLLLSALSAWALAPPSLLRPGLALGHLVAATVALTLLPLAGLGGLFLRAAVVTHIGQWLGGSATSSQTRLALSWSALPIVVVGVLHAPLVFLPEHRVDDTVGPWLVSLLIATVWAAVLEVKGVALVHDVGHGRAAAVSLLSAVLPALALSGAARLVLG